MKLQRYCVIRLNFMSVWKNTQIANLVLTFSNKNCVRSNSYATCKSTLFHASFYCTVLMYKVLKICNQNQEYQFNLNWHLLRITSCNNFITTLICTYFEKCYLMSWCILIELKYIFKINKYSFLVVNNSLFLDENPWNKNFLTFKAMVSLTNVLLATL